MCSNKDAGKGVILLHHAYTTDEKQTIQLREKWSHPSRFFLKSLSAIVWELADTPCASSWAFDAAPERHAHREPLGVARVVALVSQRDAGAYWANNRRGVQHLAACSVAEVKRHISSSNKLMFASH